jgi:hypothetical protein
MAQIAPAPSVRAWPLSHSAERGGRLVTERAAPLETACPVTGALLEDPTTRRKPRASDAHWRASAAAVRRAMAEALDADLGEFGSALAACRSERERAVSPADMAVAMRPLVARDEQDRRLTDKLRTLATLTAPAGDSVARRIDAARVFGAVFRGLTLCQECGAAFVRARGGQHVEGPAVRRKDERQKTAQAEVPLEDSGESPNVHIQLCPSCVVRTGERRRKRVQRERSPGGTADASSSRNLIRRDQNPGWEPGLRSGQWAPDDRHHDLWMLRAGKVRDLASGPERILELEADGRYQEAQALRTLLRIVAEGNVPPSAPKSLK